MSTSERADDPWQRLLAFKHLRNLARAHDVRVFWHNGRDWQYRAQAQGTTQTVTIPRPHNARQYLVALHELGHLLGDVPLSPRPRDGHYIDHTVLDIDKATQHLIEEAAAWAWAVQHIHGELEGAIVPSDYDATVGRGLSSHAWSAWVAHDS